MKKLGKNNKGFTLVELIIVIAIIAILGVVAAPQYIKYVEHARLSNDNGAVQEMLHAAEIAAATGKIDYTTAVSHTVNLTSNALDYDDAAPADANVKALYNAMKSIMPEYTFTSKVYKKQSTLVITVGTDGKAKLGTFSDLAGEPVSQNSAKQNLPEY